MLARMTATAEQIQSFFLDGSLWERESSVPLLHWSAR